MSSSIKLSELATGAEAIISSLENESSVNERLTELGFYPGARIRALYRAIFGDPTAYMIQNAVIALRRSESEKILVREL